MKPDYLRLNEVAELLECEPHHVKDLVALGRLRCGVMAQAWWGHAFPLSPDGPSSWHGRVIDINRHNDKDKTYLYDDAITGASFRVRTGYVAQFWYLHHGEVYPLCTAVREQIEDFLLEPAPGVGEQLHQEDPERWPWPEFLFWPNRDQDPPVRATWQDILFLRRDVEALSEPGEQDKGAAETAGSTRTNSAAEFNEAVFQTIIALGMDPRDLPKPARGRVGGWQARVRKYLNDQARKPGNSWLNPSANRMRHARAALLKSGRIVEHPAGR